MEYIEERWREKPRQRLSHLFGDRIYSVPYRASCFASVDLEEKVEFILFFQIDNAITRVVQRMDKNWRSKISLDCSFNESESLER